MRPLFSPLPIPPLTKARFYEGGENSFGNGDTGIDLDIHSAAGANVGDFLRVLHGFPFGEGRSGCGIESPSEGPLLSPPFGLGNLISPDSKEGQPNVNNRDADGAGYQGFQSCIAGVQRSLLDGSGDRQGER